MIRRLALVAVVLGVTGFLCAQELRPARIILAPASTKSIAGSTVTCSPDDPNGCQYSANQTITMEFRVTNASTDLEWINLVEVAFPTGWTVQCNSQDATDLCGNAVAMTCSASGNTVTYTDSNGGYGEIRAGCPWDFTVNVTVPAGSWPAPQIVNWALNGDNYGSTPHSVNGTLPLVPVELMEFQVR